MTDPTVAWYDTHAQDWIAEHDEPGYWAEELGAFQSCAPGGHVLEIGCGGGRDAEHFIGLGYIYSACEPSAAFIAVTRERIGEYPKIHQLPAQELHIIPGKFDAVWAAASLLHVPREDMPQVLDNIVAKTYSGATVFISLKTGEAQAEVEGRMFTYWDPEEFTVLALEHRLVPVFFRLRPPFHSWIFRVS